MSFLKRFINNKKGSQSIEFLATIILLMLVVFSIWPPVQTIIQKFALENIHRVTLMEMEEEGGFTEDIRLKAVERLKNFGFDETRLEVSSTTLKPVQWGSEISLTVKYTKDNSKYQLVGFFISKSSEPIEILITRSSVSREYFK